MMFENKDEQETVNMSNALQELIDDGVKKGKMEGRKEGKMEEREQNARKFAAYLRTQAMPVKKVRSTLRKWFRLATEELDKICPLL